MNNEQEWRDRLFKEIDKLQSDVSEVKKEMMSLKIKVAGFASFIGSIAGYIINKVIQ